MRMSDRDQVELEEQKLISLSSPEKTQKFPENLITWNYDILIEFSALSCHHSVKGITNHLQTLAE